MRRGCAWSTCSGSSLPTRTATAWTMPGRSPTSAAPMRRTAGRLDDFDDDEVINIPRTLVGNRPHQRGSPGCTWTSVQRIAGGEVVITWQSVDGKTYSVFSTTDLTLPGWTVETNGIAASRRSTSTPWMSPTPRPSTGSRSSKPSRQAHGPPHPQSGRRPSSYQPRPTARLIPDRAEGPPHTSPGQRPGNGQQSPIRSEGPAHTDAPMKRSCRPHDASLGPCPRPLAWAGMNRRRWRRGRGIARVERDRARSRLAREHVDNELAWRSGPTMTAADWRHPHTENPAVS